MKRNIFLINLAAAFLWLGMYSYTPVLPAYAASIGADVVMIGIIGGAYGVMQILLRIPLGIISDKWGKDRLMYIVGFIVLTASTLLFIFAESPAMLVVARGAAGAAAAWWVIVCATYTKYFDDDRQVKAQGTIAASANIGKVVAGLICALVAQHINYHATFIVACVAAVVGLVLVCFLKKPPPTHAEPVPVRQQLALLKNKELLAFSTLGLLSQMMCFGIPMTFAAVAAEDLGAGGMELGMLTLVFFLSTALLSFFVGSKPYKKMGGINAIAFSFAVGALSCVPAFYKMNLSAIFTMQALSGVCYGVTQGALAGFVVRSVSPAQRGAATGIFQSVFGIGIFAGPVIMGYMIGNVSFDSAYWTMFAMMVASAALCYVLIPRRYDKMT